MLKGIAVVLILALWVWYTVTPDRAGTHMHILAHVCYAALTLGAVMWL